MTRSNRHDPRSRTEPGIISNVFSFVSREIGEFVISATGGGGEPSLSKRKRGRDARSQHEHRREREERGRQRGGYDGSMIEQWREASDSVDGGGKKHIERAKDKKNLSADHRSRSRREREGKSRDGKKRASSGSPSRSTSGERHPQSQSRELSRSRVNKTKARTSSDGKLRANSADGYGRKKDRVYEYVDQPEDADGELTPSTSSRSPPPQHPPQDMSSSQANPPISLNSLSTSSLLTSRQISTDAAYPQLRKKPSITMPGSLFPRSDSLEPEHDEEERVISRGFLSGSDNAHNQERNPNPVLHSPESGRESEPGPSRYLDAAPADVTGPSPWRTRPIASVHDALKRFNASGGEERDFSLLVVASPAGPVRPESPGTTRKGKERAIVVDDEDGDEDLAFILDNHRVQDKEKQLDAARRETGAKSKTTNDGERERDKERIRILEEEVRMLKEELSRRRRSPLPSQTETQVPIPPPPPPLPPPPAVRIPLPPHLRESGALFASARAALRTTEASSTACSDDIRKSAGGKMRQPTVNVPSDKMAAFLNEMRTVRLKKVGSLPGGLTRSVNGRSTSDDCPGPSGLSRSVSAAGGEGRREVEMARRRKSMGAKVPIASASTSQATVSKTTSGSATSNLAPASTSSSKLTSNSNKSASTSKLPTSSSIPKPTSTSAASKSSKPSLIISSSSATGISNKRKADVLGETEGGSTSKRRSSARTQVQSDTSTSSSSRTNGSSSTSTHSNIFLAGPSPANDSSLSNGTDITTPSLCSDNELGGDADARMPSTPPGPRHGIAQTTHDEVIEIIDVDMDMDELEPPPHRPVTPSHVQGDMFRKRPPMSPLPVPTPRKPPAPARAKGKKYIPTPERTKRGATPKPKGLFLLDEDEDDDDEEDDDELALPPRLQWKRETKPTAMRDANVDRTTNVKPGKGRLTLDEELARARSSDRLVELEVESGELIGTGTRSARRGFLAGGGAGGAPVFMGVGYVRGAEDDVGRQQTSRIPRRRG